MYNIFFNNNRILYHISILWYQTVSYIIQHQFDAAYQIDNINSNIANLDHKKMFNGITWLLQSVSRLNCTKFCIIIKNQCYILCSQYLSTYLHYATMQYLIKSFFLWFKVHTTFWYTTPMTYTDCIYSIIYY